MSELRAPGSNKSSVGFFIFVILILVGSLAIYVINQAMRPMPMGGPDPHHPEKGRSGVVIQKEKLGDFRPDEIGETVSAEQFVAIMETGYSTTLAQKTFIEAANGKPVRWLLNVRNVEEKNGELSGSCELKWEIVSRNHGHGSSVRIDVIFREDQKRDLLGLRTNDFAEIEGTLEFDTRTTRIVDARLAGS